MDSVISRTQQKKIISSKYQISKDNRSKMQNKRSESPKSGNMTSRISSNSSLVRSIVLIGTISLVCLTTIANCDSSNKQQVSSLSSNKHQQQKIAPIPLSPISDDSKYGADQDESSLIEETLSRSDKKEQQQNSNGASASPTSSGSSSSSASSSAASSSGSSDASPSGSSSSSSSDSSKDQQSAAVGSDSMSSEEYMQIKPEEIGMNDDEKSLFESFLPQLTGQDSQQEVAAAVGRASSSSSPASSGSQPAEHKSAADEELNAHLAQDSLTHQESIVRSYGVPHQSAAPARGAYPTSNNNNNYNSKPQQQIYAPQQHQQQQYQYQQQQHQPQQYQQQSAASAHKGPSRQHRSPAQPYGPSASSQASHLINDHRQAIKNVKDKFVGTLMSHQPSYIGAPIIQPNLAYANLNQHNLPRHLPRGAAAGYAAFRDFVRARANKYKSGPNHAPGYLGPPMDAKPAGYQAPQGTPVPAPAGYPAPAPQAYPAPAPQAYPAPAPPAYPVEPTHAGYPSPPAPLPAGYPAPAPEAQHPAGGEKTQAPYGNSGPSAPQYSHEAAAPTYKQPQAEYQQAPKGQSNYKQVNKPNKVTIAQAYIPHMASQAGAYPASAGSVYGAAPAPGAYEQQQQPAAGYGQQAPHASAILSKLYGGESAVASAAGKPEYNKDYGMVIHYPQATVYTEPMTIDQLNKLTGSGITHVLEQVQQNLASGYREAGSTIRANNVHHIGNGVTISSKEYLAPDKSGQYVPTTAALVSTSPAGGHKQAGYPAETGSSYKQQPELGSGYERVKQAVAANSGQYQQQQQQASAGQEYGAAGEAGPNSSDVRYKELMAISNMIGAELKSLHKGQLQPTGNGNGNNYNKRPSHQGPYNVPAKQTRSPNPHQQGGPYRPANPQQQQQQHYGPMGAPPKRGYRQHGHPQHQHRPRHPQQHPHRPHHQPRPQGPAHPKQSHYPKQQQPNYHGQSPYKQLQQQPKQYPEASYGQQHGQQGNQYGPKQQPQQSYGNNKPQEQQQEHQYLALEKQMVQLLQDLRNGDEQYSGGNKPQTTGQGYPHKMQKYQQQKQQQQQQQSYQKSNQAPISAYAAHDGVEYQHGPNDQIGEISDLIETLKGALETHKPSEGEYPAQQQQQPYQQQQQQQYQGGQESASPYKQQGPKPEDVKYIASALGQPPSYAVQAVPLAAPAPVVAAPVPIIAAPPQPAEYVKQQEHISTVYTPIQAPAHVQTYQAQQAPQQFEQQQQQAYLQQPQQAEPAAYQVPQQQPQSIDLNMYQHHAQAAGQPGAPVPQSQAYIPLPSLPSNPIHGDNIPYAPVLSQAQEHSSYPEQQQQQQQQQQHQVSYQAPIHFEPTQQASAAPQSSYANQNVVSGSYPAVSAEHQQQQQHLEQNQQPQQHYQQQAGSEHTSVINHLVPVAVAQPAPAVQQQQHDSSAYQQQQPESHTSSQIPINQIAISAPTEAEYQNAQPLSSLVNSLPTEYQDLLRHPVPTAQLIDAGAHPSVSESISGQHQQKQQQQQSHSSADNYQAASAQVNVRVSPSGARKQQITDKQQQQVSPANSSSSSSSSSANSGNSGSSSSSSSSSAAAEPPSSSNSNSNSNSNANSSSNSEQKSYINQQPLSLKSQLSNFEAVGQHSLYKH